VTQPSPIAPQEPSEAPAEAEAQEAKTPEQVNPFFRRVARLPQGPDSYMKLAIMFFALAMITVLHFMPAEWFPVAKPIGASKEVAALSTAGKDAIAILLFAIILWVSEALPFPITALLVLLAASSLRVCSFGRAVELGFGHPVIMFFVGVLLMAASVTHSGVGARITFFILRHVGSSAKGVILGFLCVSALLAMWTSTLGGAAMSTPLAYAILRQLDIKPLRSNFGRALMIACSWGALFGGVATPAGSGPNPLAIGFLHDLAGIDISFLDWMKYGVPAMLLMIPVGWGLLLWLFPLEIKRLPVSVEQVEREMKRLGPVTARELYTMFVFVTTIFLWVAKPLIEGWTGGVVKPTTHTVALLGGALLFVPKVAVFHWKDVQKEIDWGGVILIAGGLCIGRLLADTGAANWLARMLLGRLDSVPTAMRLPVVILAVHVLHLAFSSNSVTGAIVIPLLVALARDLNMNPWILCGPAAFTCSQAFVLVTETPTNVIPYSTGYFKLTDFAKAGVVMTLLATLCLWAAMAAVEAIIGAPVPSFAPAAAPGL